MDNAKIFGRDENGIIFGGVCRFCLNDGAGNIEFENLNTSFGNISMTEFVKNIATLEVDSTLCLPNYVCVACVGYAVILYRFVEQCRKAHETILQWISPLSTKSDPPVDIDTNEYLSTTSSNSNLQFEISNSCIFKNEMDQTVEQKIIDDKETEGDAINKIKLDLMKSAGEINDNMILSNPPECQIRIGEQDVDESFNYNTSDGKEETSAFLSKSNKIPCDVCGALIRKYGMKSHKAIMHESQMVSCSVCGKKFKDKNLRRHMTYHNIVRNVICEQCGKIFFSAFSLNKHLQKGHEPEVAEACHQCGIKIGEKDLFSYAQGQNKKKCVDCFQSKSSFQAKHKEIKEYLCKLCGQMLSSQVALIAHENLHRGIRRYLCDICKKSFSTKIGLTKHVYGHLGLSTKTYECQMCEKKFRSHHSLNRHQMQHSGKQLFSCTKCGRTFYTKYELKKHNKNVHENAEKHPCPCCDRVFTDKSKLRIHLMVKKNIKPYKCEICERAFIYPTLLKNHILKAHKLKIRKKNEDIYKDPKYYVSLEDLKKM